MSTVLAGDAGVAGAAVAGTSAVATGVARLTGASAVAHVELAALGTLTPTGRPGGQGRVYRPQHAPAHLEAAPVVVKLYRRPPPAAAVGVLRDMIAWSQDLPDTERARLHGLTAWPLAIVSGVQDAAAGIVMRDLTPRFAVPFTMPSGQRRDVLLSLEHLLGDDGYLLARGLDVATGTVIRLRVAERISRALGFLHDRGIVVGDIAPNNLLVSFGRLGPPVSFIDCDSMVFGGRQALPTVQTTDWQLPDELGEAPGTRAADAYKLGLIVLRLLARCHDARTLAPHRRHVPEELRELLTRALGPEPALRPAPGEWQRALEVASVRPRIGALHPGPVLRPRVRPATATVAAPSGWPGP
ncbi:MAG: eukaryotic-like serine/threonine-protein kinase, partial [Solirubrobacteraceae bacterium]|nr:eukaryotic-like serine/threonine-protein kinase [Solirubrobacteraceae bacterium]